MITEPMPDLNQSLFVLATLSPSVATSLDLELYRQQSETDEATDDVIIADAIVNSLQDLATIGLDIGLDYSTLQQPEYLQPFTQLLWYLLPNGLYPKIKADDNLRQVIHHLLDGSLGSNETLIQCYLSELGGLDGQSALLPELSEALDRFYQDIRQTDTFTDYLRNIYDLVKSEKLTPEANHEEHTHYREVIRELIARVSEALNLFDQDEHYPEASGYLNQMISDLVAPSNYDSYRYLFTTDKDGLPDDLQPLFERRQMWYEVSHRWHRSFYELRHLKPTLSQLLICYAFAYGQHHDQQSFLQEVKRLAHWGETTYPTRIIPLYGS